MITNVARETSTENVGYGVDSLDRITSANASYLAASYTWDLAGNPTRRTENGVTNNCVLTNGNRLVSWAGGTNRFDAAGNSLTNFGGGTLVQYDLAGNTTNLQYSASRKLGFKWDGSYQLTEVRTNGVLAETYRYDALGRRVSIIAGAVTNDFVYSGPHIVAEYSNNVLTRSYAYGPAIDDILSMTTYGAATNTFFYLKDNLGSVHALVNTNGTVMEQYRYTAWGETTVLSSNGTILAASAYGNRFTFQGREYSWVTKLHFFRSRYYDGSIGRWLSKDRIGINGGHNLYEAFNNAPTVFLDPDGLKIRLLGTSEQQQALLAQLRQFVRGELNMHKGGYLTRKTCSEDQAYDDMISDLINSPNIYDITLGKRPDRKLVIGGCFVPDGWEGGSIYLEPDQPPYSTGLLSPAELGTLGTTLAHELVHAGQNMNQQRGADRDASNRSLETDAIRRANAVYPRMGKPLRWQ